MTRAGRHGFALLAVLWVIAGLAVLGLAANLAARNAIAGAHNRADLARARWRAEECAEQARAIVARAIPRLGWRHLDTEVRAASASRSSCRVALVSAGARLDVNTVDAAMLGALLARLGIPPLRRDSLVDALLDWRDADDVPRPSGAERSWYLAAGRIPPRNGPLPAIAELRRVRGFERLTGLDTLLDVAAARLDLDAAPLTDIAALPGFGAEAVEQVAELRARGAAVGDLSSFAARLSPASRAELAARSPELAALTAAGPEAWLLLVRATVGQPPVTSTLELRLVRAGDRAAVVRRRSWIE